MATHDLGIETGRLSPPAAAETSEQGVLTGEGESRTRPVPVRRGRKAGSARGLFTVPDDFDEPLEDFRDYM